MIAISYKSIKATIAKPTDYPLFDHGIHRKTKIVNFLKAYSVSSVYSVVLRFPNRGTIGDWWQNKGFPCDRSNQDMSPIQKSGVAIIQILC